jgi:hypothetical protein
MDTDLGGHWDTASKNQVNLTAKVSIVLLFLLGVGTGTYPPTITINQKQEFKQQYEETYE